MFKASDDLLRKLPKTDLHVHLDGSMRLSTILELADEQGVKLPAKDETSLARLIHMGENCESLEDYLVAFDVTLGVLQTEPALYRAAYEMAEDAAEENVRYMEVRYSPMLHTKGGLTLTAIVEAVLAGLRDAKRDFGIRSGLIISGIRQIDPKWSLRLAELAVAYKNRGVVGYDLAGAEDGYQAKNHFKSFHLIRSNNVNCTAHAGEARGPESIQQALHDCGSHRIGHGTRLREDGDLLNYVCDHRIPLEICLSSNVQTRAVEDFDQHPVKFYYDFGVRITMNTDNRLITDTTVTKEFSLIQRHFDFTVSDIREIIVNGFKSAFQPYRTRQDILDRAIAEMDMLIEEERARLEKQGLVKPLMTGDPRDHRKTSHKIGDGRRDRRESTAGIELTDA